MSIRKKSRRFYPLTARRMMPVQRVDIGRHVSFPEGFVPANPSILRHREGYLACVRGVNYRLNAVGMMEGLAQTHNRFLLLDDALAPVRNLPELDRLFDGLEDIRLFNWSGRIMAIACRLLGDRRGEVYPSCMTLLEIDPTLDGGRTIDLNSPYNLPVEKNWVPYIHEGELRFVYSIDPLVVLRYNAPARVEIVHSARPDPWFLFLMGGSTAGFPVDGGYLFLAHRRRASPPRMIRNHVSRVYVMDSSFRLRAGPWFYIGERCVQYINGMVMEPDRILISHGEEDKRALISVFSSKKQFEALCPARPCGVL